MALIHRAELSPSKLEILEGWLPHQPWIGTVDASSPEILGAFRFDDPDGQVGIETHLVRAGDRVVQVPVTYRGEPLDTYRGEPLDGADRYLISTMEHSVLGRRWVYDAVGDPVYVEMLARTILTGGIQAELEYDEPSDRPPLTTRVIGSGDPNTVVPEIISLTTSNSASTTRIDAGSVALELVRIVDSTIVGAVGPSLAGTWPGQESPAILAIARIQQPTRPA